MIFVHLQLLNRISLPAKLSGVRCMWVREKFSGGMALDSNSATEMLEKAPCELNVRTADSVVLTRPSTPAAERFDKTALFDQLRREIAGKPGVVAPDAELARFERLCNACPPHQAPGQMMLMQAHSRNFDQGALAA